MIRTEAGWDDEDLLAVFLTANSDVRFSQFFLPRCKQRGVAFPSQLGIGGKIQFVVPESTNTLFVFGADGERRGFPLATGETRRIYELMSSYPGAPDLAQVLERRYAEKHSSDCSARLREAIATLQKKNGLDRGDPDAAGKRQVPRL